MPIEKTPFYSAKWDETKKLLYTRFTGLMEFEDIENWRKLVLNEAKKIKPGTYFKFYVDESGYEYANLDVHAYKRKFLPEFLASYGFYLSILPSEEIVRLKNSVSLNKSHCAFMAMNHHNSEVMSSLDEKFGNDSERYFSDSHEAQAWIDNV